MSRLNFSKRPRTRSLMRDCVTPSWRAASACVHSRFTIRLRSDAITSARIESTTTSSGGKPRSAKTLPLDLVIPALDFISRSPDSVASPARCLPFLFSASSSQKHATHTHRPRTSLRKSPAKPPRTDTNLSYSKADRRHWLPVGCGPPGVKGKPQQIVAARADEAVPSIRAII